MEAQASRWWVGWQREQEMREREAAAWQNEKAELKLKSHTQLAAYHVHFCVRTLLECLLRLTYPKSPEHGGALFRRFVNDQLVDQSSGTRKLNESARLLYVEIREKLPEFVQESGGAGNPSWVGQLDQTYSRLNEAAHSFPNVPADGDQIIACGGASLVEIHQQVVVITAVQRYLRDQPEGTTPHLFSSQLNDVAVLYIFAPGEVRMLGRVTNGDFLPAAPPAAAPAPAPALEPASALKPAACPPSSLELVGVLPSSVLAVLRSHIAKCGSEPLSARAVAAELERRMGMPAGTLAGQHTSIAAATDRASLSLAGSVSSRVSSDC